MNKVKIYTASYCPYCEKAKNLFRQKGIAFDEVDLTNDDSKREEIQEKTGHMTVPVIFIGEEFIGGCDDLYALENDGKLDSKLK